ncbi:hypothetical protein TRFO_34199 [Tritrichomonas foetus]|uniref:Uncharacterized protein n=1 Tax=Tritrichomonas foetus TaxID=1144522 RepID=A0A1J4JQ42_9EUKA|nr:hypothetical protein TRFO_34199 [Tritrichomonas foetus]|eukprot:OHS99348.1 hypothetical protein TRFO_34199 [Tritrichomonas foetus]
MTNILIDEDKIKLTLYPLRNWETTSIKASLKLMQYSSSFDLQHMLKQVSLLNYIMNDGKCKDLIDFASKIQQKPEKIYSMMSTNVAEIFSQWILNFLEHPKEFGIAVSSFFPDNDESSYLFAQSTFPTIFFNFVSEQFQSLALEFLYQVIKRVTPELRDMYIETFINSSLTFSSCFWNEFWILKGSKVSKSVSDIFDVFLNALSVAFSSLSIYQYQILIYYSKNHKSSFGSFIINVLTKFLYGNKMTSSTNKNESSLKDLFHFIKEHPTSPHVNLMINALENKKYHVFLPPHNEIQSEFKTTFVITLHECILLQNLAKQNPSLLQIKFMPGLAISEKNYDNFQCVTFAIATKTLFPFQKDDGLKLIFQKNEPIQVDGKLGWSTLKKVSDKLSILPIDIFTSNHPDAVHLRENFSCFKDPSFYDFILKKTYNKCVSTLAHFESFSWKIYSQSFNKNFMEKVELTLFYQFKNLSQLILHLKLQNEKVNPNPPPIPKPDSSIKNTDIPQEDTDLFINQNKSKLRRGQKYYGFITPTVKSSQEVIYTRTHRANTECNRSAIPPSQRFDKITNQNTIGSKRNSQRISNHKVQKIQNGKINNPKVVPLLIENKVEVSLFSRFIENAWKNCDNEKLKFWILIAKLNETPFIDQRIPKLQQKYTELISGLRAKKLYRHKRKWQTSKYLRICSQKFELLKIPNYGSSLIEFISVALNLTMIASTTFKKGTKKYKKLCFKLFRRCLLLSSNDSIFEIFIFIEKILLAFPEMHLLLHNNELEALKFIESNFWALLKKLDCALMEQAIECRKTLVI